MLPCSRPFVSHGRRRGPVHRFPTLDRHCGIRFEARRTVGNGGPFCIYSGPYEGADFVINSGVIAGGDAMDQDKMSQLMLYTWPGAGGADGLRWRHICSTDGLTRCDSSSEQAMAVIKISMSYAQLCGNHVLGFFGSDGRRIFGLVKTGS